jgi:mono/diheme cytochrome c family protein
MNNPTNQWASNRMGFRKIFVFGLLAVVVVTAACRLDMQDQPRFKAQARNDFFPDLRSAREPVDGTVARGQLHEDTYFYTGKIGNNPGDAFPFPVTQQVLERGQQRYNIFCAPCHSRVGDGKGMIPSRGFSRMPPSYHIERLQKAPAGYFFDVITNGLGIMQGYSAQVPAQDRWAIVAYIRALQLSQNASSADLPSGQAVPSAAPNFKGDAPSGATPVRPAPPATKTEGGAE